MVRATAGRAARSRSKRPTSSAAKCCASAAEPPLPQARILPPASRQAPSALPLLKMYRSAARGRARARLEPAAAWGWLLAGYLAAWTLFSGLAA